MVTLNFYKKNESIPADGSKVARLVYDGDIKIVPCTVKVDGDNVFLGEVLLDDNEVWCNLPEGM